jgi:phosphopantothenoylcysteine decarboxylase/phosphopantothenate--cysteine ligase
VGNPETHFVSGRRILVGLSGGIACYKTAGLVSALVQDGAEVTVTMTDAATRFVGPLTFEALSGRPVYTSPWQPGESSDPQHVRLARAVDLMVIAPCTMNLMAKLAHGRADDAVCLIASAVDLARQPILLAPAMNETMWNQRSTQRNLEHLRDDGFQIIEPESGWQACRTEGIGRMAAPETIHEAIVGRLERARIA